MTNRLASSTSPYLLQHATNPVDWYPWGEEALARAQAEDRPIFLSIGYAACHWCHVMAHESFEDPETAALLNRTFLNIKVDREERPDLDRIYMQAVVRLTGQGGWPLSVFLTPGTLPFFGGTYWPAQPRYGMPAFRDVIRRVAQAWHEQRQEILSAGSQLAQALRADSFNEPSGHADFRDRLRRAERRLHDSYDWEHGGWGTAPKFPQPLAIEFLLRRTQPKETEPGIELVQHALHSMADGGLCDQIGGGFHRYAVDAAWRIPHFEKMLYDNALLARAYLHAWQRSGEPRFRQVLDSTLGFLLREMTHPDGGLYASLDADSPGGGEGLYYTWSFEEAHRALSPLPDRDYVLAALGIAPSGNFEGRTVLHRSQTAPLTPDVLQAASSLLLAQRAERARPATDDKIIAEWNGLALVALAESARATGSVTYHEASCALAAFLADHLVHAGQVYRTWRDGQPGSPGLLADHAALTLGFLAQYQTDFDLKWLELAESILAIALDRFSGPDGVLYDTASDHETLIVRPRTWEDQPTPSGISMTVMALLQLAALTAQPVHRTQAEHLLLFLPGRADEHPTAFASWLAAADFATRPIRQLALVGPPEDPRLGLLASCAWQRFDPQLVIAGGEGDRPALLQGRPRQMGLPTAHLCSDFACQAPTCDPTELSRQLDTPSHP